MNLRCTLRFKKNLPNYSIMESAAPFTRDFHPLDNARAEHTKRKSPVNLAIYRTLLRRERDSNPRYLSVRRFSRPVHSTTLPSLHRVFEIAVLAVKKVNHLKASLHCGERGIRTPGTSQYAGFQDRCIRPLCHLSNRGNAIDVALQSQ